MIKISNHKLSFAYHIYFINEWYHHSGRRHFNKMTANHSYKIGYVNIGIILLFIGNSPMMVIQHSVNSDWIFNTQSRVLCKMFGLYRKLMGRQLQAVYHIFWSIKKFNTFIWYNIMNHSIMPGLKQHTFTFQLFLHLFEEHFTEHLPLWYTSDFWWL